MFNSDDNNYLFSALYDVIVDVVNNNILLMMMTLFF